MKKSSTNCETITGINWAKNILTNLKYTYSNIFTISVIIIIIIIIIPIEVTKFIIKELH
jgi:hypothetical protein